MKNDIYCKAAFEQIDITPDFQVELIGCFRADSNSQGVLHPLNAQILVFEFCRKRFCYITIDSLGLTTALSDELRGIAACQLKTDISCVMIGFSHTHSAPAPLSPVNGERYFCLLRNRIKSCAEESMNKLRPCKAGWALTDTKIGENRREGCAVVDNRLGALKILDYETNNPIAVVLRVSAHANVLMCENNKISSDYFYIARRKLENYFNCPVMLLQGASGNIKPVGVDKIRGGNISDLYRISDILLNSAKKLCFDIKEVRSLKMYTTEIKYCSDVPSETEAKQIADSAKNLFGIDGSQWLEACESLRKAYIKTQVQDGTIQFFFLNEGCFCGVPDEIFCEISIEAYKRVKSPFLFLNGYTNGCTGYLPHAEEWEKGGYETLYSYLQYYKFHGHVMPYQKNTAEKIIEIVCREWEKTIAVQKNKLQ